MKLEHLSPYLPYRLKGNLIDPEYHEDVIAGELFRIETGRTVKHNQPDPYVIVNDVENNLSKFKPILRPMSDLNPDQLLVIVDHIFRDSKEIRPMPGSVKVDKGYITFYDLNTMQTYVAVKPSQDGTPLLNMSNCFDDYSIFFKLHVDMFNLLTSGLAIDINTVPELLNG